MKNAILLFAFILIAFLKVEAQQPVISHISITKDDAGNSIELAGSGFSASPANLLVRFGSMEGKILNSSVSYIEVIIPNGVKFSSISVTNLTSGLTGYSSVNFSTEIPGEIDRSATNSNNVIVKGNDLPVTSLSAFSPNGDGIDDQWVIQNIENFPDCELVIFSRSGRIVYAKVGYSNEWDGRDQNGNELPIGAYYYTITCPDSQTTSGSISIIR